VADWYFTPMNQDGSKKRGDGANGDGVGELAGSPVWDSVKRTCRFHLGTIAFGAFLIAIIEFIRTVFHYIEEKTKAQTNQLQKAIMCLISCCLRCLECCMDKINKNSFVWTAIYGDSFVPACCSSFALIWSNLARVAAISMVGDYLLLLGRFIVALLTAGAMGLAVEHTYGNKISSLVMPCVVIFLLAYLVASLFMVVFETTIDTIFLCFLVDEKYNKGAGQMLAPRGLQELVESRADESAKKAESMKKSTGGTEGYQPL